MANLSTPFPGLKSPVAAQGKEYSQSQLGPQSLFTSAALWPFDGFVYAPSPSRSFRTISDFYNRFSMLVISYYFQHLFALCYRGIAKP